MDSHFPQRAATRRAWFVACVVLAAVVAALSSLRHPIDSDEGVVLNGAWNLLLDRSPFIAAFEYIAPGSFYAVYAAWTLGAPTYFVARALAIAAAAIACLGLIATARILDPKASGHVSALVFFAAINVGPVVNHNALFLLPATWAVFFAVRATVHQRSLDFVACGLLCGVASVVLQHKGILLASAIGVALMWTGGAGNDSFSHRVRQVGLFCLAGLVPVCWLLRWPLGELLEQLVLFPMRRYTQVQQVGYTGLVIGVVITAWVFWQVCRLRTMASSACLTLVLVQAVSLAGALQRPDPLHLTVALFPLVSVLPVFARNVFAAGGTGDRRPRWNFVLGAAAAILVSAAVAGAFVMTTVTAHGLSQSRLALLAAIRAHCGADGLLYAGPFLPGLYFESGRENVTRYAILIERFNTEAQFAEARASLQRQPPACAVVNYEMVRRFGHTGENVVDAYLREHYRTVVQVGASQLMTRH